jgi:hypothetical protein
MSFISSGKPSAFVGWRGSGAPNGAAADEPLRGGDGLLKRAYRLAPPRVTRSRFDEIKMYDSAEQRGGIIYDPALFDESEQEEQPSDPVASSNSDSNRRAAYVQSSVMQPWTRHRHEHIDSAAHRSRLLQQLPLDPRSPSTYLQA